MNKFIIHLAKAHANISDAEVMCSIARLIIREEALDNDSIRAKGQVLYRHVAGIASIICDDDGLIADLSANLLDDVLNFLNVQDTGVGSDNFCTIVAGELLKARTEAIAAA